MIVGSLLLILVAVVLLVLGLSSGSSALLIGSIAASLLAAVALVVGARQDSAAEADEADDLPGEDGFPGRASARDLDEAHERSEAYAGVGARTGRVGQRTEGFGDPGLRDTGFRDTGFRDTGFRDPGPRDPGFGDPSGEPPTVTLPAQPPYEPERAAPPAYPPETPRWDDTVAPGAAPPAVDEPDAEDAEEFDDEDPPDEPTPQVVSEADVARVARMSTDVLVIDGRPRYHLPGCVHLLGRESEPLPVSEAVELGFTPCSLCEPANALLTDPRHG